MLNIVIVYEKAENISFLSTNIDLGCIWCKTFVFLIYNQAFCTFFSHFCPKNQAYDLCRRTEYQLKVCRFFGP